MDDLARIAELKKENADLKARLVAAGLAPPPADLPNDEQTTKLLDLVEAAHPKLAPPTTAEAAGHPRAFLNACHYLLHARRSDYGRLNPTYGVLFFVDDASAWLRRYNIQGGTTQRAFVAACAASAINISPTTWFPCDMEIGLSTGGTSRPVVGWRDVLCDGVLEPVDLDRPLVRAQQSAQILRTWSGDGVREGSGPGKVFSFTPRGVSLALSGRPAGRACSFWLVPLHARSEKQGARAMNRVAREPGRFGKARAPRIFVGG